MTGRTHDALFRACGIIGLIGCIGVIAGNVAGILIYEKHDWIAESISALAAGRYAWIQDAGLVGLAIGVAAVGAGLYAWRLAGPRRRMVAAVLAVLVVDIVVIALHNEYGDRDQGKFVIHTYAVYALGILFAVAAWAAARPLAALSRGWRRFSFGVAIAWIIGAPFYPIVPNAWDGLYERLLGLLFVGWFAALSWLLLQRGRRRHAAG